MVISKTYLEIWKEFDKPVQRRAATLFLEDLERDKSQIRRMEADLAGILNFRKEFVSKLPITKKADQLSLRLGDEAMRKYIEPVLVQFYLTEKVPLLSFFLDALFISHERGAIRNTPTPPSLEELRTAVDKVLEKFPEEEAARYFSLLILLDGSGLWIHLKSSLEEVEDDVVAFRAPSSEEDVISDLVAREATPESSEEFTTLDNLLIRASVSSATGEIGALQEDQLADLVDEVVALNAERRKSHFHRGFLDALFERPFAFSFRGENAERRAWYFSGIIFGLLRGNKRKRCLEVIDQEKALAREVAEGQGTPCGANLLPHLYGILVGEERFSLCRDWLKAQLPRLKIQTRLGLLNAIYEDAADLVRKGDGAGAHILLEILQGALTGDNELPGGFIEAYLAPTLRKVAQAHQAQGNFSLAEEKFRILAADELSQQDGAILCDLGLIKAGLRGLSDIMPRSKKDQNLAHRESLERGESSFREAVDTFGATATNAHLALAILGTLRGHEESEETVTHFQVAQKGMLQNQDAYQRGDLLDWSRFCLGLALLETTDPSKFQRAADMIGQGLESSVAFPLEFWERCLAAAIVFDDQSLAVSIAEQLLEFRGEGACIAIRDSGVLGKSPELRSRFLKMRKKQDQAVSDEWLDWAAILEGAMEGRAREQAESALDRLEELATDQNLLRPKFIELLSSRPNWSPVWEETDVENALVRFHEKEGRNVEAGEILQRRFFLRKSAGTPYQLEEARQILEHLGSLGLDHIDLKGLSSQLNAAGEAMAIPAEQICATEGLLAEGSKIFLIYVGGNETQAQYEKSIAESLRLQWPGVRVEFHFPGWGSSWKILVDKLLPKIQEADGIVLSNLVRTNCGKLLRKACDSDHPWFACTGRGRKSIEGSLRQAARWAVGRRS